MRNNERAKSCFSRNIIMFNKTNKYFAILLLESCMLLWITEETQEQNKCGSNIFIIYSKQSVGYREKAVKQ